MWFHVVNNIVAGIYLCFQVFDERSEAQHLVKSDAEDLGVLAIPLDIGK